MSAASPEIERENEGMIAGDILVVDDNGANLLAMEAILATLGVRVARAQSGEEALHVLLERDFAVILLDVQMPVIDGFETARMIRDRRRSRHTPIIFVTANGRDEQDVLAAYQLGAVDFLFKPVLADVLRSKVSVFVELQRRTALLTRQSELLRKHERLEHERAMEAERRRWEDESLRLQMQEMAEADRRKDEFLAVLGHELRNPLAAIVAGCGVLEAKLREAPGIDESILQTRARIDRQAQHLRHIVDDLLDLSRITSGKIELKLSTVTVQDIIEQAVATTQAALDERGHELLIEMPKEPVILRADPVRLIQGVANLLNNAVRYTDRGGHIWIKCSLALDRRTVKIQVIDSGRGIEAAMLPRVFDVFVQANAKQPGDNNGGLGLGLTIVKRLIDLHHGTVTAASGGLGRGSTFTITLAVDNTAVLPKAEHPPVGAGRPAEAPLHAPPETAPLSVVLVEDNEDIRDLMNEFLTDLGHRVQVAGDGKSGLDLILKVEPDVAIVDVGLPIIDGYEVATQVRLRLGRDRPRLVAMTGFGQEADRRKARDAGFDTHLVKPAPMEAIIEVLRPPSRAVSELEPQSTS